MRTKKIIQVILMIVVLLGSGTAASAAKLHVTTTRDYGSGSLRAAITTANTNDENDKIYLPAGTYYLYGNPGDDENVTGDLDIDSPDKITIIGNGAGVTIIDGRQVDRVFHIINGTVSISGVTIQNGQSPNGEHGGGIYNDDSLTLTGCEIIHNSTNSHNSLNTGNGGGVYNNGNAILIRCTVSDNSTADGRNTPSVSINAGDGGGIYNAASLTITNCTISNNKTGDGGYVDVGADDMGGDGGDGGGIFNDEGCTAVITNCTICNNTTGEEGDAQDWRGVDGSGGGIYGTGTVLIKNTIIADNQVHTEYYGGGKGPDCYGNLNSLGYNLIKDTSDCNIDGILSWNITGVDPMLGPLAHNGGPTRTHALLFGSPAIDAGDSTGIYVDQRNHPRPVDMPGIDNAGAGADIGAFELSAHTISGSITANGTGLPGVILTFSHNGATTATDENGNYSHPVPTGWTGAVTPSKEEYSFTPASRDYTNVTSSQTVQDYTASPFSVSVTITNPQDGAVVSGTVIISASASSSQARSTIESISNVEFYIDDKLVETDTLEPYQYSWDTTQYVNGNYKIKVKATNTANQVQESKITVTVSNLTHMSLSRTRLNFGADTSGVKTGSQSFMISGTAGLNWTVSDNAGWLSCTPTSGTGSGIVTVSIDTSQTAPGTYIGTISVESPNADNSPQTITVCLAVFSTGSTSPPFGSFDTPVGGTTVSSSVPVTGWVLDDIEVENIKIYRDPLSGEGSDIVYIGDAVLVEGARPDIEIAYPAFPFHYQAGWGYMMLTNFLPNQGNGPFTLHAIATDKEGNRVTLGTTTITCDNANAVKPFGALDTPTQGGAASGRSFINFGWALTPLPNTIPTDGSTIDVLVDGVSLGHPVYNQYREDIAALFPGYTNSDGAVGYFDLDTTQYENGVHTISWIVEDDAGNADGIGSRYFSIQNSTQAGRQKTVNGGQWTDEIPLDYFNPVGVGKGYRKDLEIREIYPDENGVVTVKIKELERVVIHLGPDVRPLNSKVLPIGSTFDPELGIFYWSPGPGFQGLYEFVFLENQTAKRIIHIRIAPK